MDRNQTTPGLGRTDRMSGKARMLKADRDQVMGKLQEEDRKRFRQFIADYRSKRKTVSSEQMPAREMLDAVGADLTNLLRQAMEAMVARDEMGPNVGDVPPDFNLRRVGSEDQVRLSEFKDQRPVALIFGSYT